MNKNEFLEAYDSYADALFRHCYFRIYDKERARDLVQDAFTKSWEYILKGGDIINIRAFLYKVLNHLIVDESRKKRTFSLDELNENGFDPPANPNERNVLEKQIELKKLMELMDKLSEDKRQLIVMRYVDGWGPKEMAEILGESENVISVRLHRALKELKKIFNNGQGQE